MKSLLITYLRAQATMFYKHLLYTFFILVFFALMPLGELGKPLCPPTEGEGAWGERGGHQLQFGTKVMT